MESNVRRLPNVEAAYERLRAQGRIPCAPTTPPEQEPESASTLPVQTPALAFRAVAGWATVPKAALTSLWNNVRGLFGRKASPRSGAEVARRVVIHVSYSGRPGRSLTLGYPDKVEPFRNGPK